MDSRASTAEIERVKAAIASSIELLSLEAIAVVLVTPVRFGQLIFRLAPLLHRLRRLVIACDSALFGYTETETSLIGSFTEFRTVVAKLPGPLGALMPVPSAAWVRSRGSSFTAPAPSGLGQIAARLRLLSNSAQPVVRIEQYQFNDHRRFIVYIPGTQNLSLTSTANPFDMRSNLLLLAGGRSNASRATELALRRAGVDPKDRVMLVGHSQGGLIALNLAKRSVAGLVPYRIEHVVTFGTPAAANDASKLPNVVSLENRSDLVPRLELRENPTAKNWVTLEGEVQGDPISAHRMESYERIIDDISTSGENLAAITPIEHFAGGEATANYYQLGQR